jgi:hypothetical protein
MRIIPLKMPAAIVVLVAGLLSAGSTRALLAQTVVVTGAGNSVTLTWGRARAGTSLVLGELYQYQVVSVTPDGTSWPSGWVRYVPPAPPVVSLAGAGDRVILSWTQTSGAAGYQVARYLLDQTGRRSSGGQITGSPVAADTYTDGLPSPALYEYQVVAVLPDGSTVPSLPVFYPAPAFATPLGVGGAAQVAVVPAGGTVWLDALPDATSRVEYQVIGLSKDGRSWPSAWVLGR